MAEEVIRRTLVDKSDLPPVSLDNTYILRYRIISEDRNRVSHWSPIISITGNPPTQVDGRIAINGDIVNIVWEDEAEFPNYDVFVSFDSQDFVYHGTTSVHNYSIINEGTQRIDVIIQIASLEKQLSPALQIYTGFVLI
jgi:hypothetical protein